MIPDGRIAELIEELDETKPHKFLDDTSISMGELRELLNTYQHSEPGRIPEGWKLVPVEPTNRMLHEAHWRFAHRPGCRPVLVHGVHDSMNACGELYRAMLAAAPEPEGENG